MYIKNDVTCRRVTKTTQRAKQLKLQDYGPAKVNQIPLPQKNFSRPDCESFVPPKDRPDNNVNVNNNRNL